MLSPQLPERHLAIPPIIWRNGSGASSEEMLWQARTSSEEGKEKRVLMSKDDE
jgi:hypothetical protein